MAHERLKDSTLPHSRSEVVADLADLFEKELRLAKAEISSKISTKINAGIWTSAAALLAFMAAFIVLQAIILAIASYYDIAMHWSCLIVAAGLAVLAAIAFSVAALLLAGPLHPLVTTEARFDSWIGQPFPDLPMTRVRDGRASHLRDYHGQVVVLNLWATWCPPCRQEMPDLARLATAYEGRGIVVVPISDDEVAQQKRFHVKIALPPEAQAIGSLGWDSGTFRPFTLILDREGRLREYSFGAHDYAWFERRAKRYL